MRRTEEGRVNKSTLRSSLPMTTSRHPAMPIAFMPSSTRSLRCSGVKDGGRRSLAVKSSVS